MVSSQNDIASQVWSLQVAYQVRVFLIHVVVENVLAPAAVRIVLGTIVWL